MYLDQDFPLKTLGFLKKSIALEPNIRIVGILLGKYRVAKLKNF